MYYLVQIPVWPLLESLTVCALCMGWGCRDRCMYTCMHGFSYMQRPEVNFGYFPPQLFISSFETRSLAEPRAHCWGTGWPVHSRSPPFSANLGLQAYVAAPGFLFGFWGSELRSSCLHESTLRTEPIPLPLTTLSLHFPPCKREVTVGISRGLQ